MTVKSRDEEFQHYQFQRTGAVPQHIRNRLGLSAGDRVEFVIEGERTIPRPAREAASRFNKYKGVLGTFGGGEKEINSWLDELRSDERPRN